MASFYRLIREQRASSGPLYHLLTRPRALGVAPGLIVRHGDQSVFERQPSTPGEVRQAWLAAELCPTRSIRTESHLRPPPDVYPHLLANGVYLCGHNHRSSFGAHSYFVPRTGGNLLFDSPQFTSRLVGPFEEMGGVSKILLSHRDDVADAEKWAKHFDAEVCIHREDQDAAPFASRILDGESASKPRQLSLHRRLFHLGLRAERNAGVSRLLLVLVVCPERVAHHSGRIPVQSTLFRAWAMEPLARSRRNAGAIARSDGPNVASADRNENVSQPPRNSVLKMRPMRTKARRCCSRCGCCSHWRQRPSTASGR